MTQPELSIKNHAVRRFKQRFPKLWKDLNAEDGPELTLHLSKKNIDILRKLFAESEKINSIINDTAHQVYCMERFGVPNPSFYIHGNLVMVVNDMALITILDKNLDARNRIKGFKAKMTSKVSRTEVVSEKEFRSLVESEDDSLDYERICAFSDCYEVWAARNEVQSLYFMRKCDDSRCDDAMPLVSFFDSKEELEQLSRVKVWQSLKFDTQIIAEWVMDRSATLVLKYLHDVFVYEKQIEGCTLLVSWNPVTYQGAILDFKGENVIDNTLLVPTETIRYTKAMQSGTAKLCYVPANNIEVYALGPEDNTEYFVYFKSDNQIRSLKHEPAIRRFYEWAMINIVLFKHAISNVDPQQAVIVPRTIRNQPWQVLIPKQNDPALQLEIEYRWLDQPDGTAVVQMSPISLIQYAIADGIAIPEQDIRDIAFKISVYHNYLNRSFVIEAPYRYDDDKEEMLNVCSTVINNAALYFLAPQRVSDLNDVQLLSDAQQRYVSSFLKDRGIIETQFPSWVDRQRAKYVFNYQGKEVYHLMYDSQEYFVYLHKDRVIPIFDTISADRLLHAKLASESLVQEALADSRSKPVIGYLDPTVEILAVSDATVLSAKELLPKCNKLYLRKSGTQGAWLTPEESEEVDKHLAILAQMNDEHQEVTIVKQFQREDVTVLALQVNKAKRVLTIEIDGNNTVFINKEDISRLRNWLRHH